MSGLIRLLGGGGLFQNRTFGSSHAEDDRLLRVNHFILTFLI